MDRLAYVAMTGARQTEIAQTINSNNLANASTAGFRADLHAFSYEHVEGSGYGSRTNAIVDSYATDFRPGPQRSTGRDLDVAIQGEGFFAVLDDQGEEAYTRAGDLRLTSGGLLTTGTGKIVVGEGGTLAIPPNNALTIGQDGTVSIQALGQGSETVAAVDRIKLVRPENGALVKGADGLFRPEDGGELAPDASVTLAAGVLEGSNVNVASTLVNMIELARQYETQIKMIRTADEDADAARALLRNPS